MPPRRMLEVTNLLSSHAVSGEFHPTRNVGTIPSDFTKGSNKKIWWICNKGHEWQAVIASRVSGNGCPYCSGRKVGDDNNLAEQNPKLASQWHPVKNGSKSAKEFMPKSNVKVWWQCASGHEWEAVIGSRTRGLGCPECSGKKAGADNNLMIKRPDIANDWHPMSTAE